jgi:O-antigen ligase
LIQGFTWNERFYWVRPIAQLTAPYGPFPSHNNYAGYIELFIPVAAAIALNFAVTRPARIFAGFAAAVMSISVVFSLSRGGMISLAAGLLFFGIVNLQVLRARRRERLRAMIGGSVEGVTRAVWWRIPALNQAAVLGGIVVLVLVGLLWLGPDTVASRLTQGSLRGDDPQGQNFQASRGWIWQDTWRMFKANPLTGVGLGAFRTAFPIYTSNDGSMRASQAHNDYLQMLSDGGLIGGVLALWFIVAVFRAFATGLRAREPWRIALVLGAGAGMFSLLVHSIFDFNLQIPSTVLLFLVLAGIVGGVARSVEERERQTGANETGMERTWEQRAPAQHVT